LFQTWNGGGVAQQATCKLIKELVMKELTKSQKKRIAKERPINYLVILVGILFFAFEIWFAYNKNIDHDVNKSKIHIDFESKELSASQVCMFGDELKMKPTRSILIEGEIYYVCGQSCEDNLKRNYLDSQFAVDEYSHHRLKKSKAFIGLDKKLNGKVKYFESEKNFKGFNNIN
jgi:hypothetical protein